jgi:hypothetical protein
VEFAEPLRTRVASGEITLTVRLWSRPQVRLGGRYESRGSLVEIDEIELLPFSEIDEADIARTGETDREALRRRAAHAGPIADDTLVYRIAFHLVAAE